MIADDAHIAADFIHNFQSMGPSIHHSIVGWLQKNIPETLWGAILQKLSRKFIESGNYVEAFYTLKTLKQGLTDSKSTQLSNMLLAHVQKKCIEASLDIILNHLTHEEKDKKILAKNIEINIVALLETQPKLCLMILKSSPPAQQFKIGRNNLSNPNASSFSLSIDNSKLLQNIGVPTLDYSTIKDGVCVVGIGSGSFLADIFHITTFEFSTPQVGIFIIESSLNIFKSNLAINDFSALIRSERVFWYIGVEGLQNFFNYFRSQDQFLPSYQLIVDNKLSENFIPEISRMVKEKENELLKLQKEAADLYKNKGQISIPTLLQAKKLKVLGITSIFTSYVQFCMRDLIEGFKEIGCEIVIAKEEALHLRMTFTYMLKLLNSFQPDIILTINYNRLDLKCAIPETIPFVNYQQDKMAHNTLPDASAKIKQFDFIITERMNLDWLKQAGYSMNHITPIEYYPTNHTLYHPIKIDKMIENKYGCDVSFFSNGGFSPESGFEKIRYLLAGNDSKLSKLIMDYYDLIRERFFQWNAYPASINQHRALLDIVCRSMSLEIEKKKYEEIITQFWRNVSEKYLRQLPLERLSSCGFNIALYGIGWDTHPRLKKHARGVAANGVEMNIALNASKITYHALMHQTSHPRVVDAAAARTFCIIKELEDDGDCIERLFTKNQEFVYFDGPEDIGRIVDYYLKNNEKRHQIAHAAFLRSHHYQYAGFAKQILSIVDKGLTSNNTT